MPVTVRESVCLHINSVQHADKQVVHWNRIVVSGIAAMVQAKVFTASEE